MVDVLGGSGELDGGGGCVWVDVQLVSTLSMGGPCCVLPAEGSGFLGHVPSQESAQPSSYVADFRIPFYNIVKSLFFLYLASSHTEVCTRDSSLVEDLTPQYTMHDGRNR